MIFSTLFRPKLKSAGSSANNRSNDQIRTAQEMKRLAAIGASVVFGLILFFVLFPFSTSGAKLAGVKIVNPAYGTAKSGGEDTSYFYYGAKITADTETTVAFKQSNCLLLAKNGKSYSKCWVHIDGASAGLSVSQNAGISMKTLAVDLGGSHSPGVSEWNASMADGPNSAIEIKIPKGGYVVLDVLWEVPQGFAPARIKIGEIVDCVLGK